MRVFISWILVMLLSHSASAQEIINANGSWINLGLDMKMNDRWDLELAQSTRFNDFVGAFAVSNTTFKASYQINDWLKVIPGYRYMYRARKSRKFNRYQLALQAGTKWNDVKLSWRTRLEHRKGVNRDSKTTRLRNKLSAGYNIKSIGLQPKVFIEYWYTFDEPLRTFTKYRVGLSLSKKITKKMDAKFGFNYDSDLNQDELERESILLMGLTYKLKRRRETK